MNGSLVISSYVEVEYPRCLRDTGYDHDELDALKDQLRKQADAIERALEEGWRLCKLVPEGWDRSSAWPSFSYKNQRIHVEVKAGETP